MLEEETARIGHKEHKQEGKRETRREEEEEEEEKKMMMMTMRRKLSRPKQRLKVH